MSLFACFGSRKREPRRAFDSWDCSSLGLSDIPKEVLHHRRTLRALNLTCNNIKDVPKTLFSFELLTELDLSENMILFLPPSIRALRSLTKLNISKNSLSTVPDSIRECQDLLHLDVSSNSLGSLPEGLTELRQLRTLSLNDCQLEELPPNIGKLSKLENLELRENMISTLPQSICHLTLLERLDLGVNEMELVSTIIGTLESLSELWLDGNLLNTLPDEMGCLRNLKFLEVTENQIMYLPLTVSSLVSLQDLHLSDNLITLLPETIGELRSLKILKLERNRLTALPQTMDGWSNLVELSASQNFLEELPAGIGCLQALENLNLDENSLFSLPPELGQLARLNILSLRANNLTELPHEVGQLKELSVLNVMGNRLQFLPFSLTSVTNLTALWIAENQSRPLLELQLTHAGDGEKMLTCILLPQHPSDSPFSNESDSPQPEHKPHPTAVNFDPKVKDNKSTIKRDLTPYPKELHIKALQWRSAREEALSSTTPDQMGTALDAPLRHSGRTQSVHRPYSLIRALSDPIDPADLSLFQNSHPGSRKRDHSHERRDNSRSPGSHHSPRLTPVIRGRPEKMGERTKLGSSPSPSPPPLMMPNYYTPDRAHHQSRRDEVRVRTNGTRGTRYPVSPTLVPPGDGMQSALLANSNSNNGNRCPSVPLRVTAIKSPLTASTPLQLSTSSPQQRACLQSSAEGQSEASTLSRSDVPNPRYSSSMESGFDADVELDPASLWYVMDTSPEQTGHQQHTRPRRASDSSSRPCVTAAKSQRGRRAGNDYDHLEPCTGGRTHHNRQSHTCSPLTSVRPQLASHHQKPSRSFDGAESQQARTKVMKVSPQASYNPVASSSDGHARTQSLPEDVIEATPTGHAHKGFQSPSHQVSYCVKTNKLPHYQQPQLNGRTSRERRSSLQEEVLLEESGGFQLVTLIPRNSDVTRSPRNPHAQSSSVPLASSSPPPMSPSDTKYHQQRGSRQGGGGGGRGRAVHQRYPSDSYYTSDDSQGGTGAEPSRQATPKKAYGVWATSQDSGFDSMPNAGITIKVELDKEPQLGLGITEGAVEQDGTVKPSDQGYHVYKIVKGSPAEQCGLIKLGDKILEINGVEVSTLDLPDIVALLDTEKEPIITLTLYREASMTLL